MVFNIGKKNLIHQNKNMYTHPAPNKELEVSNGYHEFCKFIRELLGVRKANNLHIAV